MKKRPITISYVLFYILFWPDTYRILAGLCGSLVLTPFILESEFDALGAAMVYTMVACIGYAASASPAKHISAFFRNRILKSSRKH